MFGYYKIKALSLLPIPKIIGTKIQKEGSFNVRVEGLEPPCLAALDPKSSASTNFATPAYSIETSIVSKKSECKFREYFLLNKEEDWI